MTYKQRAEINNGTMIQAKKVWVGDVGIRPCASCETRLVDGSQQVCNHCRTEAEMQRDRAFIWGVLFALFVLFGVGVLIAQSLGYEGGDALQAGGVFAILIGISTWLLYHAVLVWISLAPTSAAVARRNMVATYVCMALGVGGALGCQAVVAPLSGWLIGLAFLAFGFTAPLLRRQAALDLSKNAAGNNVAVSGET